jgi:hypothetical protein
MKVEVEVEGGAEIKKDKEYGKYDKWEIESAMRTLIEAETIKKDSEKMKYVAECMREQADQMSEVVNSISDLKKLAKKKIEEE